MIQAKIADYEQPVVTVQDDISTKCVPDDYSDEDDDISDFSLDDLRLWEEKNPPSFHDITISMLQEHVRQNPLGYTLSACALVGISYYFRDHLSQHKYKYLLGTSGALSLAYLYGWWQFNSMMHKKHESR